jgi:hypothetical protein
MGDGGCTGRRLFPVPDFFHSYREPRPCDGVRIASFAQPQTDRSIDLSKLWGGILTHLSNHKDKLTTDSFHAAIQDLSAHTRARVLRVSPRVSPCLQVL